MKRADQKRKIVVRKRPGPPWYVITVPGERAWVVVARRDDKVDEKTWTNREDARKRRDVLNRAWKRMQK